MIDFLSKPEAIPYIGCLIIALMIMIALKIEQSYDNASKSEWVCIKKHI